MLMDQKPLAGSTKATIKLIEQTKVGVSVYPLLQFDLPSDYVPSAAGAVAASYNEGREGVHIPSILQKLYLS